MSWPAKEVRGEVHAHHPAYGASAHVSQRVSRDAHNPQKAQREATAAKNATKALHDAEAAQQRDEDALAAAQRQVASLLFRYKISLEVSSGSFAVVCRCAVIVVVAAGCLQFLCMTGVACTSFA